MVERIVVIWHQHLPLPEYPKIVTVRAAKEEIVIVELLVAGRHPGSGVFA